MEENTGRGLRLSAIVHRSVVLRSITFPAASCPSGTIFSSELSISSRTPVEEDTFLHCHNQIIDRLRFSPTGSRPHWATGMCIDDFKNLIQANATVFVVHEDSVRRFSCE